MATFCLKPAGGTVMRVTQVGVCGEVLPTSCYVASRCWASIERTAEYTDPVQFAPVNADGTTCYAFRGDPGFLWYLLNITLNQVDPQAYNIMTGAPLVLDDAVVPNVVGFRTRRNQVTTANFALEVWVRLAGEVCTTDRVPYGYYIIPLVKQGQIGDLTIGQENISFIVANAVGVGPSAWGVGPYMVRRDAVTGVPEPLLTAIQTTDGEDDVDHFERVTLAPPPVSCGCQPVNPEVVVAPLLGAAAVPRVLTFPLDADSNPILPAYVDWGDAAPPELVTTGTDVDHTYIAGTYTATFYPANYSSPVYTSDTITVS